MQVFKSSILAIGLTVFSLPALAAGVSIFDFNTSSTQSYSNGTEFLPSNSGGPGSIFGYGFHLYYEDGPAYDTSTPTSHQSFDPSYTFDVGMKSNSKGIGVRDIQVGNIGDLGGATSGLNKQEVLLFEFGSSFDWTPVSATFKTGNPTTALVFGGNNVGTTAGTFSLDQMTLLTSISIDDDPYTESFGLDQTFNFIAFAAVPDLDGTFPNENFQVRQVVGVVPVPAALPLLATAFGALGLVSWRRKRKLAA